MTRGRKPKPTKLKVLQGNPGKRAINKAEPAGKVKMPRMPAYLPKKAKTAWKELAPILVDLKIVTEADRKALELLVVSYNQWRNAHRVVEREGMTYTTEGKDGGLMYRKRPEVGVMHEAHKLVQSMLAEFGLTPSSRSKVKAVEETEDPMEQFLNNRPGAKA